MGAPVGNTNATRGRIWREAIERALERRSKADQIKSIDELADKLLDACYSGDLPALKEFGDRVEGRAVQGVELGGPDGAPVRIQQIERVIVDPKAQD